MVQGSRAEYGGTCTIFILSGREFYEEARQLNDFDFYYDDMGHGCGLCGQ